MTYTLHLGDCRDILKSLEDCSIDSIVCDPPYELGFMGKSWDNSGIAYDVAVWEQCLRVLKPGGHLIAFGGTRTYHRMTCAIEDAGFEIRDQIQWIYGSGFPKSLDVSKAMDKQAGVVREVVGTRDTYTGADKNNNTFMASDRHMDVTVPATDLAKQWQGWGTALKPAHEPAVLARKPLRGTVADNVAQWGTGGLNIDETRVGSDIVGWGGGGSRLHEGGLSEEGGEPRPVSGRWPANVILDEEAAAALDAQSGVSKSRPRTPSAQHHKGTLTPFQRGNETSAHSDTGGASRFFYVAKASKTEREAGMEGVELRRAYKHNHEGRDMTKPSNHMGNATEAPMRANHHPTVKPLVLMQYLTRMVTPPGGIVLDPFMGSGSTGCAAIQEGFQFIGIDIMPDYVDIAEKRIAYYAELALQKSKGT
jgi:DNA modification methylase